MSAHQHMDVVTFLQFEKNGRYQIDNREIIESWVDKITAHVLKHGRQLIIVVVSLTSIFVSLFITSTIPIYEVIFKATDRCILQTGRGVFFNSAFN